MSRNEVLAARTRNTSVERIPGPRIETCRLKLDDWHGDQDKYVTSAAVTEGLVAATSQSEPTDAETTSGEDVCQESRRPGGRLGEG